MKKCRLQEPLLHHVIYRRQKASSKIYEINTNYSTYETGYKKSLSSYLSSLFLVKMQNYPRLKLPQPPALPEDLKKGEWYLTTYGLSMNSDTEIVGSTV